MKARVDEEGVSDVETFDDAEDGVDGCCAVGQVGGRVSRLG
jgi:hypothetical protein